MSQDHWLPGFNFNVEEWDAKGRNYETLAICHTLALARAVFAAAGIADEADITIFRGSKYRTASCA
jgi:hypothetical protein